MEIRKETITAALHVLTVQQAHYTENPNEKQRAYYEGMRAMMEMIISNYYTEENYIIGRASGHGVKLSSGEIIREYQQGNADARRNMEVNT